MAVPCGRFGRQDFVNQILTIVYGFITVILRHRLIGRKQPMMVDFSRLVEINQSGLRFRFGSGFAA